jgi:hypothetical protein
MDEGGIEAIQKKGGLRSAFFLSENDLLAGSFSNEAVL